MLKANTARGQLRNLMEMGVKLMHIRNVFIYLFIGYCKTNQSTKTVLRQQNRPCIIDKKIGDLVDG